MLSLDFNYALKSANVDFVVNSNLDLPKNQSLFIALIIGTYLLEKLHEELENYRTFN